MLLCARRERRQKFQLQKLTASPLQSGKGAWSTRASEKRVVTFEAMGIADLTATLIQLRP